MFGDIVMQPGETLAIDLDDVADYFYMLRWPACRRRENAVSPR